MTPRIQELGSRLQHLLSILKKNCENVPLDILKTQYKQPYEELVMQIREAATTYVKAIIADHLLINPDVSIEAQAAVINQTIAESEIPKQMGICLSRNYDAWMLYQMALELRRKIEEALWPFIDLQTCEVFDWHNPENGSVIYNPLIRKVYENGIWINKELDLWGKALIPLQAQNSIAAGQIPAEKEKNYA